LPKDHPRPTNPPDPRNQTQERLRESEDRFRVLVESIEDYAIYLLDLDGTVTSWNIGAERLEGYQPDEVIGQHFSRFFTPEDIQNGKAQQLLAAALSQGRVEDEGWQVRKDGQLYWANVVITALRNEDGSVYGFARIVHDLTERRQAEEERERLLAEAIAARDLLTRVMERVADGFVALDKDWHYVYVNQQAALMLNRQKPEDLIGRHIWTEYPEGVGQPFYHAYYRAMETQQPVILEDYYTPWDRWFENRIYPSPDGLTIYFTEITERKHAEIALQQAEARLRLIVQAANVGLWDWDLETNQVYYSPEWKRQIGYEDHEISNDFSEWQSRVHPDDLEAALQTVQEYLAHPYPNYRNEFRFRHKDGSYRWILVQADLVYDEQGKPIRMPGSHIDITEHKEMEQTLRESQRQLSAIMNNLPGMVYRCRNDPDRTTEFVSEGCRQLTGYAADDLLFNKRLAYTDIIHPDDREGVWSQVQDALANHASYQLTYRIITADGQEKWVWEQGAGVWNTEGDLLFLEGLVVDVTERKRAEAALRESEERLGLFIEYAPASLAMFDREMRYLAVSRRWMIDYHLSEGDILGRSHYEIFPEIPERWKEIHRRGLVGEVVKSDEDSFQRMDGSVQWLRWEVRPWYAHDGSIGGIVIFTEDITERKRAEAALRESEASLNAAQEIAKLGSWELEVGSTQGYWSRQMFRLFDLDPAAQIPSFEEYLELIHPDDRLIIQAVLKNLLEGQEPLIQEFRTNPERGAVRWLLPTWQLVRDQTGKPVKFTGTLQDITERKQAEQIAQRQLQELTLLYQSSQVLLGGLADEKLADTLIAIMEETLNYTYAAILMVDEKSGKLLPYALSDQGKGPQFVEADREYVTEHAPRLGQGITGWVAAQGESLRLGDVRADPRYYTMRTDVRSELCVPLKQGNQVIGVINIESTAINAYTESDQRLLETLAAQFSAALQNARLIQRLEAQSQQLQQLARQVITIQEDERKHISRELHDETGQAMAALKLTLQILQDDIPNNLPELRRQMDRVIHLMDDTTHQIRKLAYDLRPAALDTLDLNGVLQDYCERFSRNLHLPLSYRGSELPPLDDMIRITLYRFLQEALTNVVKHAQATQVTVILDMSEASIGLSVEDNGIGINLEAKPKLGSPTNGMGLIGIQERLTMVGGKLHIEKPIAGGTRLVASIPLEGAV
jgi:PAS domain S-box-containing protein